MVKLNKIYTCTGDEGTTGLVDGSRIPKHAARVAAYGDVDEANAIIGLLRLYNKESHVDAVLSIVQNDLCDMGADLATPLAFKGEVEPLRIVASQVDRLEKEMDMMMEAQEPLTSFVLPGGTEAAVMAHMARTVVRRAERNACALAEAEGINKHALRYLNRLSDYLFVLARRLNNNGKDDVLWVPGESR